jgi:hypothetical protein
LIVAALAACDQPKVPLCDGAPCPVERVVTETFQQAVNRKVDVLFVVDDTRWMQPRLEAVREDFARVASAWETMTPGGLAAIHVGVVSAAGAGEGGGACTRTPPPGPECGLVSTEQFLATGHCGRSPNFTRPFTEALPCMADLGAGLCDISQALTALRRTLDPQAGGAFLTGFLRPDAFLVVVFVAASDDQSGGSSIVSDTMTFLKGLKDEPDTVFVSVAGPDVGCGTTADPFNPSRLEELVDAFGGNGLYTSICDERPISRAMDVVLSSLGTRLGVPCFDVAAPPCWRLVSGSVACPRGGILQIEREAGWCAQASLDLTMSCLGCTRADDPACAGAAP